MSDLSLSQAGLADTVVDRAAGVGVVVAGNVDNLVNPGVGVRVGLDQARRRVDALQTAWRLANSPSRLRPSPFSEP
jgi:hypothetical protein